MRGKTDVMFGHKGSVSDPPVNLKTMAGYVGTDPETLRMWRKGKYPDHRPGYKFSLYRGYAETRGAYPERNDGEKPEGTAYFQCYGK